MEYLLDSFKEAIYLLLSFDKDVLQASRVSLWVAFTSTIISTFSGVPIAFLISFRNFSGKRILITVLNTLMALPTVLIGLVVYAFLCRRGIFGSFGFLYTPWAMIIGQVVLATPLICALTVATLEGVDRTIERTAVTLGASRFQSMLALAQEIKVQIIAAVIAGFGRVFAEVGISIMLGGNIRFYTRNITTTIALETSKGEFSRGIALGLILLFFAFTINVIFQVLSGRSRITGRSFIGA
ncbi:ABC transporter permease [candidate division KSB1 bacterium]|nr:MAG: ABC transporter permease [candidate division KSB1 bacterium]